MRLTEKIISALQKTFDTLVFFATMAAKEDFRNHIARAGAQDMHPSRRLAILGNGPSLAEQLPRLIEQKEWEATVGGGVVTVTVSGKKEVVSVKLDPEVVDPDDIETLEDLIVAATNEAWRKMEEESSKVMGNIAGGLGGLGGGFPF